MFISFKIITAYKLQFVDLNAERRVQSAERRVASLRIIYQFN